MSKKFVNPQNEKINPCLYTLKYTTIDHPSFIAKEESYKTIAVKCLYESATIACDTARFLLGDHLHKVITHIFVDSYKNITLEELNQ